MNILVAVDTSHVSAAVVAMALEVARASETQVLLVNVAPREPDILGAQLTRKVIKAPVPEKLRDRRELLDALAATFAGAGVECETLLIRGDPGPTIEREAQRWGAGLIVMGSHGRGTLYRKLVGSASEAVLRARRTPVLIVPAEVADAGD